MDNSQFDNHAREAYGECSVTHCVKKVSAAELAGEIVDKLKCYDVQILTGQYTYVIFSDCKYVLNNNFFQTQILPLCQK